MLPNVRGGGAVDAALLGVALALEEAFAFEGASWEGSDTATVEDLNREFDGDCAVLLVAGDEDGPEDLLDASLLLAPLSSASNSSSSKLDSASTSRCDGNDIVMVSCKNKMN